MAAGLTMEKYVTTTNTNANIPLPQQQTQQIEEPFVGTHN